MFQIYVKKITVISKSYFDGAKLSDNGGRQIYNIYLATERQSILLLFKNQGVKNKKINYETFLQQQNYKVNL